MFITTDSKTFYIRLYHLKQIRQRGPQAGAPFKDGIHRYTQFQYSRSFFKPTTKVEHFFMDHINLIRKFLNESK